MSSVPPTPPCPPDAPRPARSPFDKPSADIVLRTADRVDYRVHTQILTVASPVFEMILSLPHSNSPDSGGETADGRPVIDIGVTEDSQALEALLRICYPVEKEMRSRTLKEVESALAAAIKYEMALPIAVLKEEFKAIVVVTAGHYFRLREFHRSRMRDPVDPRFCLLTPKSSPTGIEHPSGLDTAAIPSHEHLPNMPFPDLVCRSSDEVDFQVHRGIISAASSTLCEKITGIVGQTTTTQMTQADGSSPHLPVLQLDERGTVLAVVLRMCYPATVELPTDIQDYADVLAAARKYGMERISRKIQRRWRGVVQNAPLRGYFVAAIAGWREGAEDAARFLTDEQALDGLYTSEMEHAPALIYDQLISYHARYNDVANQVPSSLGLAYRPFLRSQCSPARALSHTLLCDLQDLLTLTGVDQSGRPGRKSGTSCRRCNELQDLCTVTNEMENQLRKVKLEF
ncbi:hypothetical protein C8Q74DRAFT_1365693 [Fomes fomentarius]|nr:hypothetical protein C8Q74DRAFT_1365693 [Fomes fomentarius]